MMERQQEKQLQELTKQALLVKQNAEKERQEMEKLKQSLMLQVKEEMKKELANHSFKEHNDSLGVVQSPQACQPALNSTLPAPRAAPHLAVIKDEGGIMKQSVKSLTSDKANSSIISKKALIPPLNLPKDGRPLKRVPKEDEKEQWAAKKIQSIWKKQKRSTDFSIESTPDSSAKASRNQVPLHPPSSQPTPPSYPPTKPLRKPSKFKTNLTLSTKGLSGKLKIKEENVSFSTNWLISTKLGRRAREEPPDVRKLPTSLVSLNGIFEINEGASGYKARETLRVLQTCVGQKVHKVVEGSKNLVQSLMDSTGGATAINIEVNCSLETVEEQAAGEDLMMEKEEQMANLMLVIRGNVRGQPNLQIEPEELMLADLSDLLGHVVCKDVLSHGKPVRQLHTFQDFCNYMVYPYLVVTNDTAERRHLRFVMFARAVGLLQEPLISTFFNTQVALIFNHVEGHRFRVSLVQAKCQQLTIQIDVVVEDNETYDYYFQEMQCNRTKNDYEVDSEGKEMQKQESDREKWLTGVKIKEGKHFEIAQLLQLAVKTLERVVHDKSDLEVVDDVLKGKKTVRFLFEQIEDFALFRLTIAVQGKRAVLWAMQQIPLEFKENTGVIKDSMCVLKIRSGWHIFVHSLTPVQMAQGRFEKIVRHFFYSHQQIERQFGVPADSIRNQAELLLFLDMALDSLQLEIPDQQDLEANFDGSKDARFYQVSRRFLQTFCHKRLLKQTATLNPITLQLIGIRKLKILGVKITLFNPVTLRQQGVFFKINPEKWKYSAKDIERQKQHAQYSKYNKKDPLVQYSHVFDALNDFGFKILLNELQLRKGPEGHLELLLKTPFGPSRVDVLERIFDKKRYFFQFQTYF